MGEVTPEALLSTGPGALEVFLSSTIEDFKKYRLAAQNALKDAEISCFLPKNWVTAHVSVMQECRERVQRANAFLLLLGHWYGSIPPDSQKSITHMEYDWACERWATQGKRPIAVFRPQLGSKADQELKQAAEKILQVTKVSKRKHENRLKVFRNEVINTWNIVHDFKDRQDLLLRLVAFCSYCRVTPLAAAQSKRQDDEKFKVKPVPADEKLGLLGRKQQFDTVDAVFTNLALQPTTPSCAFLVSGNEDAGHRVFLQQLLQTSTLLRSRPTRLGRPPHDQYDVAVLISWVAKVLGLAGSGPVLTLQDLAQRIAAELKHQPLCFALDQVHRLSGGVLAFQQHFWLPLYDLLREARAQFHNGHRLFVIVADYTDDTEPWKDAICEPTLADTPIDYQRLLLLPRLTNFSKTDVARWLMDVRGMKDDGSGRLGQVVENVLCNVRGEPDPTPLRVFQRLQDENLWPEDGES